MKIISKPDIESWKYTFTCSQCTSKLEAESSDVIYAEERQYSSDSDIDDIGYLAGSYHVSCLVCRYEHRLNEINLPHLLKEKVREKYLDNKYKRSVK